MTYTEKKIRDIISKIPAETMDFTQNRKRGTTPSMVSSEFITNKQLGDWTEELLFNSINESSKHYVAVRYGKSDDIVAGDKGFKEFYEKYQDELDTIGKRPDLLIFKKSDYREDYGLDISDKQDIDEYVKKAIAGIEVRSSAFLHKKYDACKTQAIKDATARALQLKDEIISGYADSLQEGKRKAYLDILNSISENTLSTIQVNRPSWRSSERLSRLSSMLSKLRTQLEIIQSQKELSITPKMEDMAVVYKWIQIYGAPPLLFSSIL